MPSPQRDRVTRMMTTATSIPGHDAATKVVQAPGGPANLAAPWSLEALIRPVSVEEFCSQCWGRVPLHIQRGRPDFYRDVISLEYIERYLSLEDIFRRPDTIYLRGYDFWSQGEPPRNLGEAYDRMRRGQPLQFRNLERVLDPSSPLPSLVRDMERTLQHPKQSISCYLGRANAAGLGPHHDETEIFTLQVAGRKRWRLFHQVHTDKPAVYDAETLGSPSHEVLLEAGDVLYHPRGWIHDVVSEDVPSFSITIVIQPVTWKDVLQRVVDRLGSTSPFVDQLPAGVLLTERASDVLSQPFEERLASLREALATVSIDEIVEDLAARHVTQSTLPPGHRLDRIFAIDRLTLDSLLARRQDVSTMLTTRGDGVVLLLPGGYQVAAPVTFEPAVRWILGADGPFRVRDLEGPLSDDEKLALAKRLVTCGLLNPV